MPEVALRFATHYETYKLQIVMPIIKALKSCHGLVVLVDVLMILAGGVGMYDDTQQVVIDFSVWRPKDGLAFARFAYDVETRDFLAALSDEDRYL
jgi:hypothetical protein